MESISTVMQDNVKIYQNITAEKFAQLLVDVEAAGATVEDDVISIPELDISGTVVTLKGVQIQCAYMSDCSSLALTIIHKSFPSNLLGNDKIFALIEAHGRLS
jgi:hypothetical protein